MTPDWGTIPGVLQRLNDLDAEAMCVRPISYKELMAWDAAIQTLRAITRKTWVAPPDVWPISEAKGYGYPA